MKPRIIIMNNNIMHTIIHTALFYFIHYERVQILDSKCTHSRLEYESRVSMHIKQSAVL